AHHSCALRNDNSVWCWGSNEHGEIGDGSMANRLTPVSVLTGDKVTLRAGGAHTCAINTANTMRCWGANDNQELLSSGTIVPTPTQSMAGVLDVFLGAGHRCTQTLAGVYCVGYAIASGDAGGWKSPASGDFHTCAIKDGFAGCWGADTRGQCSIGAPQTPPVA